MQNQQNKLLQFSQIRRQYKQPHNLYDMLRSQDQIFFDRSIQSWLVTAYGPSVAILDDSRFSAELGANAVATPPSVSKQILFLDGELHQQAQDVILHQLAYLVRDIPNKIRDFAHITLSQAHQKGEIDIVKDFASPISLFSISHVLGISTTRMEELHEIERWSDTFSDITSGYFGGDKADIQRLEDYFRRLIAYKRYNRGNDLLSAFLQAEGVYQTEDDLIANCIMVFAAGRATTKKLLGNGIPLLVEHWSTIQPLFQKQPRSLVKQVSEELLRYITPTRYLVRQAREDVDLSGQFPGAHHIKQGEKIFLFLEAANRDGGHFPQPDQFQPQRRPNKHIAFGYGTHQCPGATLARMEIQIALETFLTMISLRPEMSETMPPIWNPNPNLGGYSSCPFRLR
ncbi:cytochrome P450 [Dictyobacter alpinus]|uniref:Cytochrome P450 n=1 Tax=Dictyobacter alpinus TaxID=2014873 RepID=A0A402BB09_9CHLR|nr:cytochrome P450 [Dictyobacter alpinus]GCE28535.1 cytochrome P450 [Dictyobacter alpinus]